MLKGSQFCLTQHGDRISWEAPAGAVNSQVHLECCWTARETDRPLWSQLHEVQNFKRPPLEGLCVCVCVCNLICFRGRT